MGRQAIRTSSAPHPELAEELNRGRILQQVLYPNGTVMFKSLSRNELGVTSFCELPNCVTSVDVFRTCQCRRALSALIPEEYHGQGTLCRLAYYLAFSQVCGACLCPYLY